jgi:hypothetical protein
VTKNVVKDGDVHDRETANVIADTDQEVAKDVNVVDLSHLKISLDVESHLFIGMFLHQVLNILHLFNIKPCKVKYNIQHSKKIGLNFFFFNICIVEIN